MRRNETFRRTFLVFACINALSKKILRTALHAEKNISLFVKNIRHIFQITSHIFQNICLVFSGFCHVLISMKLQKRFSSLSAQMHAEKIRVFPTFLPTFSVPPGTCSTQSHTSGTSYVQNAQNCSRNGIKRHLQT